MTKPPNHKESNCKRCDNCNHAEWTEYGRLWVYACQKHEWSTKDWNVCDDWEIDE